MIRIAVDVMGGDWGLPVTLPACLSFLQSHEQARRLDQLLGLMRSARKCRDVHELDRLEEKADDIFAATLQVATHEEIDPNRLAAFSLALEQVRHAIAERRRLLGLPEQATHVETHPISPLRAE